MAAGAGPAWVLGRSSGGVTDRATMAVRMEDKDVQALQYTRPSPSLEVVRTLSLHSLLSLSSPFRSILCILSLALLRSSGSDVSIW